MEIFNGMGESIIIMVVAVGGIFAMLMLMHVISDVYKCSIRCLMNKIRDFFK